MKKNIIFKLFTFVFLFVVGILPSIASDVELTNMAKVVVNPIQNNTYTLNLYFDDSYKGKAFLHKVSEGSYMVFLPDTQMKKRTAKLVYKNKFDKNHINIEMEQKPYTSKDKSSNYVKIAVNMNGDYSLKLLSKNVADDKFSFIKEYSNNTYSLIILSLLLFALLMFKRLTNIVKKNKTTNSYTSFPDSFYAKQPSYSDDIKFKRNLKYNDEYVTMPQTKPIKTADTESFGCFDIPPVKDNGANTYNFNSTLKQTSSAMKNKPEMKKTKKQTNPIEAQELDLPILQDVVKKEEENKGAELLSMLNITPTTGLYLTTVEDTMALFGFVGEEVFLLKRFNDLTQINLQARFYDKNGDNDVYIVRLDSYKAMIEISNNSMKELAVL